MDPVPSSGPSKDDHGDLLDEMIAFGYVIDKSFRMEHIGQEWFLRSQENHFFGFGDRAYDASFYVWANEYEPGCHRKFCGTMGDCMMKAVDIPSGGDVYGPFQDHKTYMAFVNSPQQNKAQQLAHAW